MEQGTGQPDPFDLDVAPAEPRASDEAPAVAEVMELAEKLEPGDRTQLIIWLFGTLPAKNRSAIMAFGLENLRPRSSDGTVYGWAPHASPRPSPLWQKLFDTTETSDLYSAPRRFDLATIFVVTAAYSILFGAMAAMDFGPLAKITVGFLVTTVAASQAFYQNVANPRGVSVVAGAITMSVMLVLLTLFVKEWRDQPIFVVVVLFGLVGGAIAGYLSGVLVGGVFLIADALRKRFERRSKQASNEEPVDEAE
jgi:hypothetical protein